MKENIFFQILRSIFILSLFISSVNSAVFSDKQIETLKLIRKIALQYPNKNGETFENTAMAIGQTETSLGVFKIGDIGKDPNIFNASLGIMQVRLETAKFLAKKINWVEVINMSDVELVNKLLGNDKFNVTVAVKYIVWLNEYTHFNYFRTVSRYNGGNYNRPYYQKVMRNMDLIRRKANLN